MRRFGEMEFVGVEGGFERNKWHFWRRRSSKWRRSSSEKRYGKRCFKGIWIPGYIIIIIIIITTTTTTIIII